MSQLVYHNSNLMQSTGKKIITCMTDLGHSVIIIIVMFDNSKNAFQWYRDISIGNFTVSASHDIGVHMHVFLHDSIDDSLHIFR
jgi:hypothetical protein